MCASIPVTVYVRARNKHTHIGVKPEWIVTIYASTMFNWQILVSDNGLLSYPMLYISVLDEMCECKN